MGVHIRNIGVDAIAIEADREKKKLTFGRHEPWRESEGDYRVDDTQKT